MTLHYTVTKEDYLHFCMYSYDHNEAVTRQVFRVRLLYAVLIALLSLAIYIFRIISNPLPYLAILWVVCIILIACTKKSLRKANEKQCRKQIDAGHGTEFLGAHTMELLDDHLIIANTMKKSEIGYDNIVKIGQDAFCMYVHCGSLSAILLPLTAFQDDKQHSDMLELLKKKCPRLSV